MFRLSRKVFNTILEVLSPFLNDGMSRNHQQNVSASLKLGVALYCFAHGGDSFHLEAASGLSRPTALKYVHQVAELICTKLGPHWMGPALLEQEGLSRGETHVFVHCTFINLMKTPNEKTLIFNEVPSNHFMF